MLPNMALCQAYIHTHKENPKLSKKKFFAWANLQAGGTPSIPADAAKLGALLSDENTSQTFSAWLKSINEYKNFMNFFWISFPENVFTYIAQELLKFCISDEVNPQQHQISLEAFLKLKSFLYDENSKEINESIKTLFQYAFTWLSSSKEEYPKKITCLALIENELNSPELYHTTEDFLHSLSQTAHGMNFHPVYVQKSLTKESALSFLNHVLPFVASHPDKNIRLQLMENGFRTVNLALNKGSVNYLGKVVTKLKFTYSLHTIDPVIIELVIKLASGHRERFYFPVVMADQTSYSLLNNSCFYDVLSILGAYTEAAYSTINLPTMPRSFWTELENNYQRPNLYDKTVSVQKVYEGLHKKMIPQVMKLGKHLGATAKFNIIEPGCGPTPIFLKLATISERIQLFGFDFIARTFTTDKLQFATANIEDPPLKAIQAFIDQRPEALNVFVCSGILSSQVIAGTRTALQFLQKVNEYADHLVIGSSSAPYVNCHMLKNLGYTVEVVLAEEVRAGCPIYVGTRKTLQEHLLFIRQHRMYNLEGRNWLDLSMSVKPETILENFSAEELKNNAVNLSDAHVCDFQKLLAQLTRLNITRVELSGHESWKNNKQKIKRFVTKFSDFVGLSDSSLPFFSAKTTERYKDKPELSALFTTPCNIIPAEAVDIFGLPPAVVALELSPK